MSQLPNGRVGMQTLEFTEAGIGVAVASVQPTAGFDALQASTLAVMGNQNAHLVAAHTRLLERVADIGDKGHVPHLSSGFMLGFRLLEGAAANGLIEVDEAYMTRYEDHVAGHPDRLEAEFGTDYAGHPIVRNLLSERLHFYESRYGATLILMYYREQANIGAQSLDQLLASDHAEQGKRGIIGGKQVHPAAARSAERRLTALIGSSQARFSIQAR